MRSPFQAERRSSGVLQGLLSQAQNQQPIEEFWNLLLAGNSSNTWEKPPNYRTCSGVYPAGSGRKGKPAVGLPGKQPFFIQWLVIVSGVYFRKGITRASASRRAAHQDSLLHHRQDVTQRCFLRTLWEFCILALRAETSPEIKPDTTFTMSDGSRPRQFECHRLWEVSRTYPRPAQMLLSDSKVNVVSTEGWYQALAIAESPLCRTQRNPT